MGGKGNVNPPPTPNTQRAQFSSYTGPGWVQQYHRQATPSWMPQPKAPPVSPQAQPQRAMPTRGVMWDNPAPASNYMFTPPPRQAAPTATPLAKTLAECK